ncbi:hypothetical protein [Actinokineospora terrae]|uniref:Uncharacterized protein n=1 Tax=Actinokineospora terrae TaxID=155974 RepID=A0A1H9WPW6_9PSEU|nr:hypothetical protein [Actinokineospora terrae]SES35851.1 hypothetical protein SAMN04487818_11154 [Actinokineospora terrae]
MLDPSLWPYPPAAVEAGMTVAWLTIEDLGDPVRRHRTDDSITRALAN